MSEYLSSVKAAEQEVKAARRQLNQAEKNKKNQIRYRSSQQYFQIYIQKKGHY